MAITCREYDASDVPAVVAFNQRLKDGGERSQFPASPISAWLPKIPGRTLFQEYYLAVDETAAVRGAFILKHQNFCIKDRVIPVGCFHLPISEGVVNRAYSHVGVQLLMAAWHRLPLLYTLGIGGYKEAFCRLLAAAGWRLFSVPFYFRVINSSPFLQNLSYLRRSTAMRWTLDAAALTGLGWLGIRGAQALHGRTARRDPAVAVEPIDEFSAWADDLWRQCHGHYGFSAVRDSETLRLLYPKENERFIRLKVSEPSRVLGWAVALDTQLADHKHFGAMRLGSIIDCFASPADTTEVVGAVREYLQRRGVDLIVSNQSQAGWCRGFREAGFLRGPSNFIFASSRNLSQLFHQAGVQDADLHFTRGDGDGPIHM